MTHTDQINPIVKGNLYYHLFSAKELEEMNRSTHFPVDYNQRFEETIK